METDNVLAAGTDSPSTDTGPSVLVIAELPNTGKIRRHVEPLATATDRTTMVCLTPAADTERIDYETVPAPASRYVGIVLMFFAALYEAWRGDYDAIVTVSLFPYGCYGLVAGAITGLPVHLAILGIDLDHHADASYGVAVWALFRRFDTISVPGTEHVAKLVAGGIDRARVFILSNAIDAEHFRPASTPPERVYDCLWIGRFSEEKNPLLFVRALARLHDAGLSVRAVMVGSGPLVDAVETAIEAAGLEDAVVRLGWVDDPLPYYRRSKVVVLTSRREGLPLTLLEAMATGRPTIVPPVGSVTDVAVHGETSLVVPEMTADSLATALETLLTDDRCRAALGDHAERVRESYSYAAAAEDWRRILAGAGLSVETSPSRPPAAEE